MMAALLPTRSVTSRPFAIGLAFFAFAQVGCKEAIHYTPVSAAEVHHAVDDMRAGRPAAPIRDGRGEIHEARPDTPMKAGGSLESHYLVAYGRYVDDEDVSEFALQGLVTACTIHPTCALDDPRTQWQVGARKRVPNGVALLLGGLGAALVAGNVVCFGTDACSGSAKTLIGFTDGLLGAAALVAIVGVLTLVGRL